MKKQIQYLLVGYPFSGKTVLAKELEKRFGFLRLGIDAVKFDLGYKGISDSNISDTVWKRIFRELDRRITEYLKQGKTIVNEYAWLTKDWRNRARNLADKLGIETKIIFINIPEKVVRERWKINRMTKERFDVPDDVFEEAIRLFEFPTPEENILYYNDKDTIDIWIKKYIK